MKLFNKIFSNDGYDISVNRYDIIFIMLITMISYETVMFGTNANPLFNTVSNFFILMWIPLIYLKNKYSHVPKIKNILFLPGILMVMLLTISTCISQEVDKLWILRISLIIAGFYYVKSTPLKIFMVSFEKVMFFLVSFTLIVYVLTTIMPGLLSFSLPLVNSGGYRYHNYLFTCIYDNDFIVNRLQGPFREPGVAIVYFIYALAFYFINTKKINYYRVFIYSAAILLTYSTTGYITLMILLVFVFANIFSRKKTIADYFLIFSFVVAAISVFLFTDLFSSDGVVFGKLAKDSENASTMARAASVTTSLEIIQNNPCFGVGSAQSTKLFESINARLFTQEVKDNTNLFMSFAVTYGVFYALLSTIGLFLFAFKLRKDLVSRCILCISLLLVFFGETMFHNILIFILIAYGFNYKRNYLK